MSSADAALKIFCLGPEGSFSHLLAGMRFADSERVCVASVGEVFEALALEPQAKGIVPIENSSGGFIIDTVDRLLDPRCDLSIEEELTLDVKLALLGHEGSEVREIHSHPMPFFHCDAWLREHYPDASRVEQPSTALAASAAAASPSVAAIGSRRNAGRHGLDVLHHPIAGEVPNITQFFLIGHGNREPVASDERTGLVVELPDTPGSLCRFLTPLSDASVNMKRLESRPIRGQPNQYRFYVEIEGSPALKQVSDALDRAKSDGASIRSLGSYPASSRFES
jgi:prephenate dehydratase